MLKKILLGVGLLILIFLVLTIISLQTTPPPLLVSNFVDLEKIEKISKFRSCAGHVTVPQNERESRRSMKHYFWVKREHIGKNDVLIYAPYDAYVFDIRSDPKEGLEGEIWLTPRRLLPFLPPLGIWHFSVQHIKVRDDLNIGSFVKAGDIIGTAAAPSYERGTFDVVYAKPGLKQTKIDNWNSPFAELDSVFNHMSEEVFTLYKQYGVLRPEDIVIDKQTRDGNLCQYQDKGPYFLNQDDPDNWISLGSK